MSYSMNEPKTYVIKCGDSFHKGGKYFSPVSSINRANKYPSLGFARSMKTILTEKETSRASYDSDYVPRKIEIMECELIEVGIVK